MADHLTRREFLRTAAAGAAWAVSEGVPVLSATKGRKSMANQHGDSVVPRYGRWHGEFDPGLRVERVVFTGPDGAEEERPAFVHQPARLRYDDHGYESIEPQGDSLVAVRFTAVEVGPYGYRAFADSEVVAQGEFRCEPSDHPGFVQISERDSRYFAHTDGTSYCAIGLDACWPSGGFGGKSLGAGDYRRWFRQLSAAGANFARLWVGVPYFDAQGEVAGQLDPAVFTRLDAVLALARQYGIRLKLCLEYFRAFDRALASQWITLKGPDGGPCSSMDEWFESDAWQALWWTRVDAYLARYGNDPTIMAWELWNEINCCATRDWSVQRDWTRRVLPMLKVKTPRNLVTNSIGSFDVERYQSWYDDFKMEEMEFQQVHRYLDQGAPWELCHFDAPAFSKDAVERARRPDRPVLLAETGAVDDGHSGSFRYYQADHRGLIFHDTTFPAFFAGAAGTGHIWHWDNYVDSHNLWGAYRPFADLIAGLQLDAEDFRPADLSNDQAWCYALMGREHWLLWVRNRADCWYRVLRDDQEPGLVSGQQFDLGRLDLHNGAVTTIWPWGESKEQARLENGKLQLPPFRFGLFLKVKR